MALVVRAGNPQRVFDWEDLARPGVEVRCVLYLCSVLLSVFFVFLCSPLLACQLLAMLIQWTSQITMCACAINEVNAICFHGSFLLLIFVCAGGSRKPQDSRSSTLDFLSAVGEPTEEEGRCVRVRRSCELSSYSQSLVNACVSRDLQGRNRLHPGTHSHTYKHADHTHMLTQAMLPH